MAENLQKYLDKYKNKIDSDRLFSDAQLRSKIEKSKPTEINPKANFFSKYKGLFTMTIIGSTIIFLMMMLSSGENTEQLQTENLSIVKTESINKTEILNTSDEIGKKEITTKTPTDIVVDSNDDCCKLDADQALDQDLVLEAVPADEILIDDGIDDKNQEGNNQEEKPSEVKQGSIDKFIENIPDEPNVGGVVYLELTIEEMEKIGIKKINDSYNFRFQDSSPDTGSKLERGLASILSFIGINTDNVFYECSVGSMFINHKIEKGQGWGTREVDRTLPVSVTVYESHYTKAEDAEIFGHTIRSYENNWESPLLKEFAPDIKPRNLGYYSSAGRDGEYSKKFDRLVPLSIFYGDPTEPDSSKLRYGNIQIWYIATKELAELLPPRYSEPILKELALLTSIENGMIPLKEACREMEDQTSYFNMCTMTSRTIEYAKVYPNPVSDQLTCKFELNEASNIRIALFAQSGSFIKYLNQTQKLMSGVHSKTMQLPGDLTSGVYLIAVMSENGDRVITKIIAE